MMNDPRDNREDDELAEPRRQLMQLEAEIQQTGKDYHRIVHEGAAHFQELHRKAAQHLDEDNIDEYAEQAHSLATMLNRHAQAASRFSKS